MKNLKGQAIVGPTLRQVQALGLDGPQVDIATAFYSRRALNSLAIKANRVRLLFRVDLERTREWERGYVAPDALLDKIDALIADGVKVDLFGHPKAHVKAYVGSKGALVGSANLTLRGLGGGLEMAVRTRDAAGAKLVRDSLSVYQQRLSTIELDALRDFVSKHLKAVRAAQATTKRDEEDEDRLPDVPRDQAAGALGSYAAFLTWLGTQAGDAAKVILDRAEGQSQLQGHIRNNFYGLRQFFLAYPEFQASISGKNAAEYRLFGDAQTEANLKDVVLKHATDEQDFRIETWKSYLPAECGGRVPKRGGTIGNLNRMLPLVAKYLEHLQKRA